MTRARKAIESYTSDQNVKRGRVLEYLPYVKRMVNRIAANLPGSVDRNDLINAGVIGLIAAIDRYDPTKPNTFLTYATFKIRGAILGELRSRDYLSRSDRKKSRDLENAYLKLENELGRQPEDEEVAQMMEIDLNSYYEIKRMAGISFLSFEEIGISSREQKNIAFGCLVHGTAEDAYEMTRIKEVETAVADTIRNLPEKEKLVISLYYWNELTMKEIGEVLELSESRVSQLHSGALVRLKTRLRKKGILADSIN